MSESDEIRLKSLEYNMEITNSCSNINDSGLKIDESASNNGESNSRFDEFSSKIDKSNFSANENSNIEFISGTISDQQQQQQTTNCIEKIMTNESHNLEENYVYELDREFLCDDDNDDLPEGWIRCNHDSGMPFYLHEEMKVCSFSKPYFLGANSLKNHEIPIANIPCLNYRLGLQKKNNCNSIETSNITLSHEQYRKYCSKIFNFKSIKFMRFSSWDKRREYIRMAKADRRLADMPKFKDKSHLMSFPVHQSPDNVNGNSSTSDQWTINLNGKSYVSILHEYIQRVLKTQPSYEFKELENARFPYLATVILDEMQYGIGIGSSKKQAKLDAARATIEILIPSVKNHIQFNRKHTMNERQGSTNFLGNLIFDKLKIKDSRIPEFCSQAAESMPYDMLQICVKKNFGEDEKVECIMQNMQCGVDSEYNFYRCTMSVRKYSATVICRNKREGRQKGAQALLKVLHPHIQYFGSLLRLYSHQNFGSSCEKKLDEPGNQSPKPRSGPNNEILRRLRAEMSKLK